MNIKNNFGGDWTGIKLDIFEKYLTAYIIALNKQPFEKIYIDAFAGSGEYTANDVLLDGSVKKALNNDHFVEYHFIEINKKKSQALKEMIHNEYPHKKEIVKIYNYDATDALQDICNKTKWKNKRALMLLDPFAMDVKWETFQRISRVKFIDIWYLIPIMAYNRLLTKKADISLQQLWKDKIVAALGYSDWEEAEKVFYAEDQQVDLFGKQPKTKAVNFAQIEKIIYQRLATLFGSGVLNKMVQLKNKKNSHLFSFCFICTNDNPKALALAKKLAKDIVKNRS